MSRRRSTDRLVAAEVGSARLEGLDVSAADVELAEAYAAGEIDTDGYIAEMRRRIVRGVPASQA